MDDQVKFSDIPEVQHLVDHLEGLKGAIVTVVTNRYKDHEKIIEDTRRDLDVFRKAYRTADDAKKEAEERFETEKRSLLEKLNALQRVQESEARQRRVVALIDGDGTIFLPSLIAMGKEGGGIAASKLTESITSYLSPNQFQLHVYVFHNKRGLTNTLKRSGLHEASSKFDDFIVGFNQAAERFAIIDAGDLKESSDHKIRAYLEDNIYSPHTMQIFFGGCHDNGYISTLNSYITSGFKEKLILLPGYSEMAYGIEKFGLPSLAIPDLFLLEKLTSSPIVQTARAITPPPGLLALMMGTSTTPPPTLPPSRPTIAQNLRESTLANGRRGSDPGVLPRSAETSPSYRTVTMQSVSPNKCISRPHMPSETGDENTPANGRTSPPTTRYIDHRIPIWKHDPPPCTLHYLANCKYEGDCKYGHDYVLNDDDFEMIRDNARANPCSSVMRGEICSWGDKCVYGHKCPQAPKCVRQMQGKCKFSVEGMHTLTT